MFSQVCVKNSVHWGVYTPWADTPSLCRHPSGQTALGRHPLGKHPLPQVDTSLPKADISLTDTPHTNPAWADTPLRQTATAADGKHPTGMHSC